MFAILATSSLTIPSFAQESINEITITVDKDSYEFDEQISVSGTVKEKLEGYDVILRVFSVTGN
ncbi:MAG: hypothetical protein HZC29_02390, partial [Thaumarchaeota archaeon]|nr:hypothetical protein [Nitrososphaerota archaeon]